MPIMPHGMNSVTDRSDIVKQGHFVGKELRLEDLYGGTNGTELSEGWIFYFLFSFLTHSP